MNEETSSFAKLFIVLLSFVGLLWFIYANYGADLVIVTLVILAGTIFFIAGAFLSHSVQKSTLNEVSKFAAKDALTDRYRMQSMREIAKSDTYTVKTNEQIKLLEAKQNQKLLNQPKDETTTFWETNDVIDTEDWN